MWFLTLVSYLAIIVQLMFITIAIALLLDARIKATIHNKYTIFIPMHENYSYFSTYETNINEIVTIFSAAGLYYLAELVEEYTTTAKKVIWWMNATTMALYILLWIFESFPKSMIICGVLAQCSHFVILTSFPFISFLTPGFLAAIAFIVINHYLAFSYFASNYYPFSEVIAYFTLFLWLVPFALFVSLSANDNVLPTTTERIDGDVVTNYFSKRSKKYGLLTFFNNAKETLLPVRTKKGF